MNLSRSRMVVSDRISRMSKKVKIIGNIILLSPFNFPLKRKNKIEIKAIKMALEKVKNNAVAKIAKTIIISLRELNAAVLNNQ
ncbi:hypothetical protein HZA40_00385 [Candidatus Peregrinibacteria bacterium]|nr:hypothetical protein [Candidatus Peregrinibacteria bacterium]